MEKIATRGFWAYQERFWALFVRNAAPWARDNIFWGIAVLVIPPLLAAIRIKTATPDWATIKLALWLYLVVFIIYCLPHLIRVPWKLDQERVKEADDLREGMGRLRTNRDKYLSDLKQIEDSKPRIVLREGMSTTRVWRVTLSVTWHRFQSLFLTSTDANNYPRHQSAILDSLRRRILSSVNNPE